MNQYTNNNEEIFHVQPSFDQEPGLNAPRIDALRQVRNIESGSNIRMGNFLYNISSGVPTTTISGLPFQPAIVRFDSIIQFSPGNLRSSSTGYYQSGSNFVIHSGFAGTVIGRDFNYSIYHQDNTNGVSVYGRITAVQSDGFTISWDTAGGTGFLYVVYTIHK